MAVQAVQEEAYRFEDQGGTVLPATLSPGETLDSWAAWALARLPEHASPALSGVAPDADRGEQLAAATFALSVARRLANGGV